MSVGDKIDFVRDCDAIEVPSGVFTVLRKGTKGELVQTLGGSYTVRLDDERLFRIAGVDADAIGEAVPEEARMPASAAPLADGQADPELLWAAMRTCYDPEIPVNVVDLGLIYDCRCEPHPEGGSKVKVVMTLTAPGCPMSGVLRSDILSRLRAVPGAREVEVDITFDPPWDSSRLSDAARLKLGIL